MMLYLYMLDMLEKGVFGIVYEHCFDFKRILSRSEIRAMIRSSDTSDIPREDLRRGIIDSANLSAL